MQDDSLSAQEDDAPIVNFIDTIHLSSNKKTTEEKREDVRGRVTLWIAGLYAVCVTAIIATGMIIILCVEPATLKRAMDALELLVGFLNVLLLPVVTLVLGFYFGSEKRL